VLGSVPLAAPAPVVHALDVLTLVDQNFDVAADGVLALELQLSPDALTDPTAHLVVTAHRPVDTRTEVAEAIAGDLTRSADSIDLDVVEQPRIGTDTIRVAIPVERSTRTPTALQLSRPGLYPVVVELRRERDVTAELLTFAHRLPDADEPDEQPLLVAVAMSTKRQVLYDEAADTAVLDDNSRAELARLAASLEVSAVPVAVELSPVIAAALSASGDADDVELATRLSAALASQEVLAVPHWPLDASAAAAAGVDTLYRDWLREGEDALAAFTDTTPSRAIGIADTPLSAGGGALLREVGGRLLVVPVAEYDAIPDSIGGYTDSTQLVQMALDPDTTIDAAVVDRLTDDLLLRPTGTPLLAAIHIAADLAAAREQIEDGGGLPSRHGLVLATPDIGVIPADLFGPLSAILAATPTLRPVTLEELSLRVDRLLIDGTEVVVELPDSVATTITPRTDLGTALALESISTSSMLPDDDPRNVRWQRLIELLPSSALNDGQAESIAADLRTEFADVRGAVELPESFSFTLTGRQTEVPVKLFNSSDGPLTVVVRLTSTKLLFPSGDITVTLPSGEYTDVLVPIEARSNGKFPVTLEVLTPIGDSRLSTAVPLAARVNALSGLANLLTGTLLLVLITWWVRHVRRQRRVRFGERHPSAGSPAL
jgi:hypothetical protein